MNSPIGTERRDPFSPVLKLGNTLSIARLKQKSGWIELKSNSNVHGIHINHGAITNVVTTNRLLKKMPMYQQASYLFSLSRPNISWIPEKTKKNLPAIIDPSRIVISGITARTDLFDPRALVSRIPLQTLHITPDIMSMLKMLPLTRVELDFLYKLNVPTPIPIILWKRGLDPRYAGALLVALNVIGLWHKIWKPGLLPKLTTSAIIIRRLASKANDYELLGISDKADFAIQDKAFRKLSLDLHPDRQIKASSKESHLAALAFQNVNAAYSRIKQTRRKRPVRHLAKSNIATIKLVKTMPDKWTDMLKKARFAYETGKFLTAKSFALKAIALSPPGNIIKELKVIIVKAA